MLWIDSCGGGGRSQGSLKKETRRFSSVECAARDLNGAVLLLSVPGEG